MTTINYGKLFKTITKEALKTQTHAVKFGKKLQEFRKEMNLTQKEMAEKLFIAESTYANWEQGRREPNLQSLAIIKNTLNISYDELLDF